MLSSVTLNCQVTKIVMNQSNFKVLFTRPHAKNAELFQAIVRVSNEVRAAIAAAGDKLSVDLTICKVFDHFHVRRCNQCQGYHHFKDTCTKPPRCGNCAGDHQTEDCTSAEVKCANCADNKYENTSHKASDPNCKSYIAAQKKLEQSILQGSTKQKTRFSQTGEMSITQIYKIWNFFCHQTKNLGF